MERTTLNTGLDLVRFLKADGKPYSYRYYIATGQQRIRGSGPPVLSCLKGTPPRPEDSCTSGEFWQPDVYADFRLNIKHAPDWPAIHEEIVRGSKSLPESHTMIHLSTVHLTQFSQMRDQATPGSYWQIYQALADLLSTQYGVSNTELTVLWLRGVTGASAVRDSMSLGIEIPVSPAHPPPRVTKKYMDLSFSDQLSHSWPATPIGADTEQADYLVYFNGWCQMWMEHIARPTTNYSAFTERNAA